MSLFPSEGLQQKSQALSWLWTQYTGFQRPNTFQAILSVLEHVYICGRMCGCVCERVGLCRSRLLKSLFTTMSLHVSDKLRFVHIAAAKHQLQQQRGSPVSAAAALSKQG
jgi:hypothetical protein